MGPVPLTTRMSRRAGTTGDEPFLRTLYAAGRAEEFAALSWPAEALSAFLDGQFEVRRRAWAQAYPQAYDQVVLLDHAPVGRLLLAQSQDGVRVVDLAILPRVTGQGIGTWVLDQVLRDADRQNQPVHLHVLAENPARRLYERLGFVADSRPTGAGTHVAMTRTPST